MLCTSALAMGGVMLLYCSRSGSLWWHQHCMSDSLGLSDGTELNYLAHFTSFNPSPQTLYFFNELCPSLSILTSQKLDVMHWEGHNIIFVVFLPNVHHLTVIIGKCWKTPRWGTFDKIIDEYSSKTSVEGRKDKTRLWNCYILEEVKDK